MSIPHRLSHLNHSAAATGTTTNVGRAAHHAPVLFAPLSDDAAARLLSLFEQIEQMKAADARDEFYAEAVRIAEEHGRVSISLLQRRLRIGYNRAARLVEQLEEAGVIGPDAVGQSRASRSEPPPPSAARPPASAAPRPRIIGGDDAGGELGNEPRSSAGDDSDSGSGAARSAGSAPPTQVWW